MLQDYVVGWAEREPARTAIVMGEERLTYGELEAESNRLGRLLTDSCCRPGDRIALAVSKSPTAVVAMHAVMKAGGAYVPLDVASPAARTAKILHGAEPVLIVSDRSGESVLGELEVDVPVVSLESRSWRSLDAEALDPRGWSEDMTHILFTSGSTGTPKGVVITHAMVHAFVGWAVRYFGTRESDRISGHPPLHFDLSTFDIYGTFAAGAELHLVPPDLSVNPKRLASLIRDSGLTQWFSVPSVLTYMAKFDAVGQDDFPALERLLWCGEVLPTPVLAHWMKKLPHVRFTNLYGPTEATIASSYFTVPDLPQDETEPVPIGAACDGEELLVLDADLRSLPTGETGDLYIGGVGLSPGYWRDEEKTEAAFVESDGGRIYRTGDLARKDGQGLFHFLGRADSQIKSRGYRIELGEIEAALNAVEGLRECAVVGVDSGGFEGTAICAAFSAADGIQLEAARLRAELARSLPSYMLPSAWLELEALPKNVNGKIDRRALRSCFKPEPEQGVRP